LEGGLNVSESKDSFLLRLSDRLWSMSDAQEMAVLATDLVGKYLKTDRIFFTETRDAQPAARGAEQAEWAGHGRDPHRTTIAGDIAADLRIPASVRQDLLDTGIQALLVAPVLQDGNPVAQLWLEQHQIRSWQEDEIKLARLAAKMVWKAIERNRLETGLRASEQLLNRNQILLSAQKEAFRAAMDGAPLADSLGILVAAAVQGTDTGLRCAFYLANADGALSHVVGMPESYAARVSGFVVSPESLACGLAVASGEPVVTVDILEEPRWESWKWLAVNYNYRACWSFPVETASGKLVGALTMYFPNPRSPAATDVALAAGLTQTAAIIISRTQSEAALRSTEGRLAKDLASMSELHSVVRDLVGSSEPQALYDRIVRAAALLMRADAASLQVLGPQDKLLRLIAHRGIPPSAVGQWEQVSLKDAGVAGRAHAAADRVCVEDIDTFAAPPGETLVYRLANFRGVQSTPLCTHQGVILGMLSTFWQNPRLASDRELRFFDLLVRMAADLVERMRADELLRLSEERLRQFGEASRDVLWIRDARTMQWQYLTPAFEDVYGMTRDEVLKGDNFRSWLRTVFRDDRRRAIGAMRRVRQGEHTHFDYRIRRPADGTVRWLRSTIFPIRDASGAVALIGGIGQDLSELRRTGLRLQTLMEGIPQLVWRAVDGGQWTWSSPQWTKFTGLSGKESHGHGWVAAIHPDDREAALLSWREAIQTGNFAIEARIKGTGTQYRWFQNRATPVRDELGEIVEWLGTSTDIHDLRELQERQRVLVGELQHRTRNLLGVVRSLADKSMRSSTDLTDFRGRFNDRIDALARAQGLLSRLHDDTRVTFDALLKSELGALGGRSEQITLRGPADVFLRSSTVQTLALAIHELATNAVKHGALAQAPGHLHVTWRMDHAGPEGSPRLDIDWRESGVTMKARDVSDLAVGSGRELIERALPYQVGGETSFRLEADGVHCRIRIPVSSRHPETSGNG